MSSNIFNFFPHCKKKSLMALSSLLRGQDLNLRPSGYEPDELPDCSTPQVNTTKTKGQLQATIALFTGCVVCFRIYFDLLVLFCLSLGGASVVRAGCSLCPG